MDRKLVLDGERVFGVLVEAQHVSIVKHEIVFLETVLLKKKRLVKKIITNGGKLAVLNEHIKNELEAKDIYPIVENGYQEGLDAGIIAGTPSTIHLYVLEIEVEKAMEIIDAITT